MTWYWWSHWFWITFISVVTHGLPLSSVDTISLKSLQQNTKNYNKPLKFPLAAQSDSEDIYTAGEEVNLFKSDLIIVQDTWTSSGGGGGKGGKRGSNSGEIIPEKTNEKIIQHLPNNNLISNISNSSSINTNSSNIFTNSTISDSNSSSEMTITPNFLKMDSTIESSSKITNNSSPEILDDDHRNNTDFNIDASVENSTEIIIEGHILKDIQSRLDVEPKRKSKILAEFHDDLTAEGSVRYLERSAAIRENDGQGHNDNLSSEALTIVNQDGEYMSAGIISGITFSAIGLFCGISVVAFMIYRRRYINKPQTLSEPDSSGYIDDSTIRDNSDEMYSLDNDSFLNSLEAMTIQNYWTDVKHTKL